MRGHFFLAQVLLTVLTTSTMRTLNSDWFSLDAGEVALYPVVCEGIIPGIRIHFSSSRRVEAVDVHRNQLPVLDPTLEPPRGGSSVVSSVQFPFELRDYQQEDIAFARDRAGSLMFHALGMGKTPIGLGAADFPAAVLCPTSAITVWLNEAAGAGLKTQVLHGLKSSSSDIDHSVDLYIITYGSAHRWMGYFRAISGGPELHTIIADEAQMLQKKALKWSQAFRSIARKRTILLTATPMRNRLRSLWALLDAAHPRAWGSQYEFRRRYCDAYDGDYGLVDGGVSYPDELAARLGAVSVRRTWDDPRLAHLRPTLNRSRLDVEITAADRRRVFDAAVEGLRDNLKSRDGKGDGMQIALMGRLRRQIGLLKAQWLATGHHPGHTETPLEQVLSEGDRVIFWVWHKENAEYLYRKLKDMDYPVDKVTGESLSKKRREVLHEWQYGDHTQPRALVATIGALNAGVNLTTARVAVFIEYDYAPLMVQQAECRHHRHGSKFDEVYAYYLQVPGTIDERMAEVLLEKTEEAEAILGSDSQTEQMRLLVNGYEDYNKSDDDILSEAARRLMEGSV